jgi:hypothetical protein
MKALVDCDDIDPAPVVVIGCLEYPEADLGGYVEGLYFRNKSSASHLYFFAKPLLARFGRATGRGSAPRTRWHRALLTTCP